MAPWSRLLLLALLAAGWLGVCGVAAEAAVPSGNLIVNGNAESGTGSSDSSTTAPVPIPGWTTTTNLTEHTYDPAGSAAFPDVNASAAIGGGSQFFAGGPANGAGNTVETATQNVGVSTAAAEIDAGGVTATVSADLGGFATQRDNAAVTATFLGSAGEQLGTLTIGPVTAADRNNTTALLPRSGSGTVPPGTRTVRVALTATKTDGSYNDAYADNLSLTLAASSGSPPPPTTPPPVIGKTLNVTSVKGKVLVRLPNGHGFVALTAASQLPVGTKIDARRGTIQLLAASTTSGKTQTGTFGGAVFGLAQASKGRDKALTTLSLLEGVVRGGPSYASCRARRAGGPSGAGATAARVNRRTLQLLHATASGRFKTRGRYAAATVRGTIWDTADRCDGTLVRVRRGVVSVTDFVRHKTVTVRAGHSYLAKAR
ncbi:MAG: hypothetical protein ACXVR2_01990 [Solirubrobacteraceae bacterium]